MKSIRVFISLLFLFPIACIAFEFSISSWFERWIGSSEEFIDINDPIFTPSVIGAGPDVSHYYSTAKEVNFFTCLEDKAIFPFSRVNDNYCDCRDGSDEPGTSACAGIPRNLAFTCVNAGAQSLAIPLSHVNDGICDCCDGSDEYKISLVPGSDEIEKINDNEEMGGFKSKILSKCVNTCEQDGKIWRQDMKQKQIAFQKGLNARKKLIEQGLKAKEAAIQLEKIKREAFNSVKVEYTRVLDLLNAVESEEKMEKESYLQSIQRLLQDNFGELYDKLSIRTQTAVTATLATAQFQKKKYFNNVEVRDLLDIASRNNVNETSKALRKFTKGPGMSHTFNTNANVVKDKRFEEQEHSSDFLDDFETDHINNDLDTKVEVDLDAEVEVDLDMDFENSTKRLLPESLLTFNFSTDKANDARKQAKKAKASLNQAEQELKSAEKDLNENYGGPDWALHSLKGKCISFSVGGYTYEICPYGNASQKPLSGGASVSLGKWEKAEGSLLSPEGLKLVWSNGAKCWKGPYRSLVGRLECSEKEEILVVDEPEICMYTCIITTPAACIESSVNKTDKKSVNDEL